MGAANIEWIDLGLTGYDDAFAVQTKLHERRMDDEGPDTILFQENFHIVTLGRWASAGNLRLPAETLEQRGVAVRDVSRGGDVTYHGPGQLVISPILKLEHYAPSAHEYMRRLEQVVINLLAGYGIQGHRVDGATGVWLGDNKIAAIGIAVNSGVTQHGVAINVSPNLSYFDYIIPCGLADKGVTSMKREGCNATLADVRNSFLDEFSGIFGVTIARSAWLAERMNYAVGSDGPEVCRGSAGDHTEALAL